MRMNPYFRRRDACPACESTSTSTLRRLQYDSALLREYLDSFYRPQGKVEHELLAGVEYVLQECGDCGLVYQGDVPNDTLMTKIYEEWIDPEIAMQIKVKQSGLASRLPQTAEILNIITSLGGPPFSLTFFDFGMGWGEWLRLARGFGCEVYGAELSPARIRHAKDNGIEVLGLQQIMDHRFDVIRAEQVLEHIPNPLQTLRELAASLKPRGVLQLGVPDGARIKELLEIWDWRAPKGSPHSLNMVAPLEHINCFQHDNLVEMAAKAGLTRIDLRSTITIVRSKRERRKENLKALLPERMLSLLRKINGLRKPTGSHGTHLFFRKSEAG